jgi:hypothetical protein
MMGMFGSLPASMSRFPVSGWQPAFNPTAPTFAPGAPVDPSQDRLAQIMATINAANDQGGGAPVASNPAALTARSAAMSPPTGGMPDSGNNPSTSAAATGTMGAGPQTGNQIVPVPNGALPSGMFGASMGAPAYAGTMPPALIGSNLIAPQTRDVLGNPSTGADVGMLGAQAKPKKPGFNDPGGWAERLAAIGDVLGRAAGMGSNGAMEALIRNRDARRHDAAALAEKQGEWAHGDALERMRLDGQTNLAQMKLDAPQYFTVGRDRLALDPVTGATRTLFHGQSDAEDYATNALGLSPGTPAYKRAVQDYVLKSAGPTAYDNRTNLEGVRQGDRLQIRATPTYANLHPRTSGGGGGRAGTPRNPGNVLAPILAKAASGAPLNAGETALYNRYMNGVHRGGAGGGTGGGGSGKVYTDGKGNRITWNGSGWVPAK